MQEIRNLNPPVYTGICDPNKTLEHDTLAISLKQITEKQFLDYAHYAILVHCC